MSEIRQNIATRDWVIIATERAKRPEDFSRPKKEQAVLPAYEKKCPFCPGNEELSPVETYSIRGGASWKVRAIPNKFPALSADMKLENCEDGIISRVSGSGIHDVIIESPRHDMTTALLSDEEVLDIVRVYKRRYADMIRDERMEHVIIFKNHGEAAGTSQVHPHSQMVATPVVPVSIRYRIEEAMRYYDDHRECVFCKMIREELKLKERVVMENDSFVSFVPYAALSPFHTWILPKQHFSSFMEINDREMEDFARILKALLKKLYAGLGDPDYNYVIRSIPGASRKNSFYASDSDMGHGPSIDVYKCECGRYFDEPPSGKNDVGLRRD